MKFCKKFYLSTAVTLILLLAMPVITARGENSSKYEYRITPIEINLDLFQSGKKIQIGPYDFMAEDVCFINMSWDGGGEITVICKPIDKKGLEKVIQVKSNIPEEIVINSNGEYSFTVVNSTSSVLTNFDGTINCKGIPINIDNYITVAGVELYKNDEEKENLEMSSKFKVIKEIVIPMDALEMLSIEMDTELVTILPSKDESIKIINYGNQSVSFLDEEKVQIGLLGNKVTIYSGKRSKEQKKERIQKVEIYIPSKYNSKLKCSITKGSIDSKVPFQLTFFESKSGSGKMDFGNIVADDYHIEVGSGDMGIALLNGSGKIIVNSGNVIVNYIDITDTLGLECYNGYIECNVAKDTCIDFKGSYRTGSINTYFNQIEKEDKKTVATVGNSPFKKLTVNTNSGNIKIAESK